MMFSLKFLEILQLLTIGQKLPQGDLIKQTNRKSNAARS
jgi:hypothetical protein